MGTLYAGVWRQGNDPYILWGGVDWTSFSAKWQQLSQQNLRLVDLKVYTGSGPTKFSGVWRAGSDAHYLWVGLDWNTFQSKWQELSGQNQRLVDLEIYTEGGVTKFAGVWRAGSDAHYLLVGLDRSTFQSKWQELSGQNLRLVDLEIYTEGGATKYAGVWRGGSDAHYLWLGADWENFNAKWYELGSQNLRLTRLEAYSTGCSDSCLNQVVMRDDPSTPWADTYNYGIPATNLHCKSAPGACPSPSPSDMVYYRWPCITSDGSARYARLSAISYSDAPLFKLPFNDTAVKQRGPWLYSPGNWHHAIDFSRDDSNSFPVRAAAAGKVIFIGWDWWSGNTIIISHDSGGVVDAFRTIYMHLRNGPSHDADQSWNVTLPHLSDPGLTQFKNYLTTTGCPQGGPYKPDPTFWGTDADKINMNLLGAHVNQGDIIGHAGCTGPGGCGCTSDEPNWTWGGHPNTHLHIFFARRDPTDKEWYFVDPYGIYSSGSCYPAINTPITTPCARYPVAWVGGKAQYP